MIAGRGRQPYEAAAEVQRVDRVENHPNEQWLAGRDHELQRCRGACSGNIDWRMRRLHYGRDQGGLVNGVELPLLRVFRCCPQTQDHADTFLKALLTLVAVEAIAVVLVPGAAAPKTDIDAPVADDIDHGNVFGQSNRVV